MDISTRTLINAAALSTIAIRLGTYLFTQWIPGHHFPPLVFTSFIVYISAAGALWLSKATAAEITATTRTVTSITDGQVSPSVSPAPDSVESTPNPESAVPIRQIEAIETVVYEKKPPHPLKTLLLGIPSTTNWKTSLLTFIINAALVASTWDLTFRAHYFHPSHDLSFARPGYVGHDMAKILVREPNSDKWPVSVWYAPNEPETKTTALAGSADTLSDTTDYTQTFLLPRLIPETKYRWFTSSNHTGTFTTSPLPGTPPKSGTFTFLHTSCIKPRFPYNPLSHPLSIRGFQLLARALDALNPSFMLFLGDWIYIDVPHRSGNTPEDYRKHYRQMYASPDWPSVGDHLPWIHVLDDHEIANDWDKSTEAPYPAAVDPFHHYHHLPNPPPVAPNATYYSFTHGTAASFFLLDTRTYRSPKLQPDGPGKTMLGAEQLDALLNWLTTADTDWKFIISSVPFTKNWHYASAHDTWAGYLHERAIILDIAWSVPGVVVLSGDRHEFAATKFPPKPLPAPHTVALGTDGLERHHKVQKFLTKLQVGRKHEDEKRHDVWEFSCSPLNMFYLPIRTYSQWDEDDVTMKYLPDGNVKWGSVKIESGNAGDQAVMRYGLWVEGEETWSMVVTADRKRGGRAAKWR